MGIGLQLTGDPYLDALINSANSGGIMSLPLSPETANTVITLGNAANTSQVTQTSLQGGNALSSNVLDIFGKGGLLDSPFHILGYLALAYGGYTLVRRRRLSMPAILALGYGFWASGMFDSVKKMIFGNTSSIDGKTALTALGSLMPGTLGSMSRSMLPTVLTGGSITALSMIIPLVMTWLAKRLKGTSRRRFSYRRRFYPRRRYYRRSYAR